MRRHPVVTNTTVPGFGIRRVVDMIPTSRREMSGHDGNESTRRDRGTTALVGTGQSLASAGAQHDIGFVEGSFQAGVFGLSGDFKASSGSAGVQIVYQWQFRDGDGVLIDRIILKEKIEAAERRLAAGEGISHEQAKLKMQQPKLSWKN